MAPFQKCVRWFRLPTKISAKAAILIGSLKCSTHFLKGTTQGSYQQSLVEIGSVVSEKILFIFLPPFFYFKLDGHLGWKWGSSDTNLEGGHPRTIPPKLLPIRMAATAELNLK
jgi:hypothetical protein